MTQVLPVPSCLRPFAFGSPGHLPNHSWTIGSLGCTFPILGGINGVDNPKTVGPCDVIRSIFGACTGQCTLAIAGRRHLMVCFGSDADFYGLSKALEHYSYTSLLVSTSILTLTEHTGGGVARHC